MSRTNPRQLSLVYHSRGGPRPGAGRKKSPHSGVPHLRRPALASRFPVHISVKLCRHLPGVRNRRRARIIERCIWAASQRKGFRVVHFSIQPRHLHLVVEARGRSALSRGMQSLNIRMARRLNAAASRKGQVIADRYHEHILRTPMEVRRALSYVLLNDARHEAQRSSVPLPAGIDLYSSGPYFDGWKGLRVRPPPGKDPPVSAPHTWLLRKGWRRHGLINPAEIPGAGVRRAVRP